MRTLRTVAELRAALAPARRHGRTVGLVPTMGAFHEGHLALMRAARERCDVVVVSLFVNPAQFDRGADLASYPRDEARDAALAAAEGVDVLFVPPVDEVYPDGFATTVRVGGPAEGLEGEHRPGHFDGVATVVAKLFNVAAPDVAFFGAKDAQQVAVVRRLVRDLDLPVEIDVRPTVREPDGLAMSSRNALLSAADRERALALSRALRAVEEAATGGEGVEAALAAGRAELEGVETDYLAAVHPQTLRPAEDFEEEVLVAVAARVGGVRLIDNTIVGAGERAPTKTKRGIPSHTPRRDQAGDSVQRMMLKSKIHRATVTGCDLHYVGSITIDPDLLEAADIRPHEQVHVVDVDNGARFETYTIAGERGSREVQVNGAAARLVHDGDTVIVISYASYDEAELDDHAPRVVHVTRANEIVAVDERAGVLAA